MVSIKAEGSVERCFRNEDNTKLVIAIEDGGKWPTRLTVFVDGQTDVQQGDTVTVSSERLPYVKERTYTAKDGNEATAKDLILPAATVSTVFGQSEAQPGTAEYFGGEVPF